MSVDGQAQSSLNSQSGGLALSSTSISLDEEHQNPLLCLDEDKPKRKLAMRKSKSCVDLDSCRSLTHYIREKISNLGWDWREAEPITSKQEVTYPGISSPEGSKRTSEIGGDEEIEEAKKRMLTVSNALAVLTLNAMISTCLVELRGVLSEEIYQNLHGSAFRCIAGAIINIFDTEDLERIGDFEMFLLEYTAFSSGLDYEESFAKQEVRLDEYSILREHDIFCKLQSFQDFKNKDWHEEGLQNYLRDLLITEPYDSAIEMAETVIQSCAPLKREDRMQLMLEMMFEKRYLVYDALVLKVLAGIVIDPSLNEDVLRSAANEQPNYALDVLGTLSWFVSGIVLGLSWLMRIKSSALKYFQKALIFPVLDGDCFGPCKQEVVEIIKFADFARRMQNQRCISSNDLLFCLSLSRVGSSVKRLLDEQLPSELSLFMVYKHARTWAGSGNDMTLDHLVMAFFPGKHQGKDNTLITDGKILDDSAWDAELRERLCVTGYERGDVVMWNSFQKSWNGSDRNVSEFSSAALVSAQLGKSNYRLYDRNKTD